ncbi:hypothetical protein TNCV_1407241 [Trichonephila clavipes]|nr:hypothetical protein TNCV_1407241 [Trichonephila clavipes]
MKIMIEYWVESVRSTDNMSSFHASPGSATSTMMDGSMCEGTEQNPQSLQVPNSTRAIDSGCFIQEVQPVTPLSISLETSSVSPFILIGIASCPRVLEFVSAHSQC